MDELRELYQSVILDHKKPRNFCEPSGANRASGALRAGLSTAGD